MSDTVFPEVGSPNARFRVGETLWHGARECRLVAITSSAYLLFASAFDDGSSEPRTEALELARGYGRSPRDIRVVVYADDNSIGILKRSQLSREQREWPGAFKRPGLVGGGAHSQRDERVVDG